MVNMKKSTFLDIANKELTVLVRSYSTSNDDTPAFDAYSCTADEARTLIEELTRSGRHFQVVRPITTTVKINIEFDETRLD